MQGLEGAEAKAAAARAALPRLRREEAKACIEQASHASRLTSIQAQLQELRMGIDDLMHQAPVHHRMMFDCFVFKDPQEIEKRSLVAALEAIAGIPACICIILKQMIQISTQSAQSSWLQPNMCLHPFLDIKMMRSTLA